MKTFGLKSTVALLGVLGAGAASAAFDATAITGEISAAVAPALAVGSAVLVAYAGIWLFKLIRRAM